ncbi:MAG: tetratricopeptide repeat protein [bacterium]|nr:tetratricopeptide repeat protein [bacterium]
MMRTEFTRSLFIIAFCGAIVSCDPQPGSTPVDESINYVGATVCAECHARQASAWSGSHHDRAMQEAGIDTVLGDFENARFAHAGASTRFFRREGEYHAQLEGPDGEPTDLRVLYTFGVEPLQQYLVGLPGGRLQALTVAWDSRPRSVGGQRWFSLYPDEVVPSGDVLHWSGAANNWNSACAHCHSTGLRKRYDAQAREYQTSWSDIDVACEACHGPGSKHLTWARLSDAERASESNPGLITELAARDEARWVMNAATGIAERIPRRSSHTETQTCAHCHSRRALLSEDPPGERFFDSHQLALLEEGLYEADGQILDEVFVYGSFLQSRMYAAGVSCGDCHEPHSLALRAEGNALCVRCHASERFDTRRHHQHTPGSEGARCVECHMPSRTYMQVDVRRDHGFRVPRPDLSVKWDVPNACNSCHAQRSARWAATALERWPDRRTQARPNFTGVFARSRRGDSASRSELRELAGDAALPGIVRATALHELSRHRSPSLAQAIAEAARDADPLLRAASARVADALAPPERVRILRPLLSDRLRSVRIEAGRSLAESDEQSSALAAALEEYRAVQVMNADQPSAHVNLGILHFRRGELDRADAAFRDAIATGPYFLPAYVNLADLYRVQNREDEAESILLRALEVDRESAEVHHALGLSLVRQGRLSEALEQLGEAARLAPEVARIQYVYGIALSSAARSVEALRILSSAHERHPHDVQLLSALATISRDMGRKREALAYARKLEALTPGNADASALRRQLEADRP